MPGSSVQTGNTQKRNVPVEHESLESLDFHPDFLFLDRRRGRRRGARQAVHRRRQRVRLGSQVTRKVDQ